MFTQYINHFINRLDQKKTVDQLQKFATSQEGAISIATILVLTAGVSFYKSRKFNRGCPKVPNSSVIFGSAIDFFMDPKGYLNKWHKELGDVFSAEIFGKEIIIVSGSQVREVFLNEDFNFNEGIKLTFDSHLLTNSKQRDTHISPIGDPTRLYITPNMKHFTPYVIEALTSGFHEFNGDISAEGKDFEHAFPMIQHMVAKASAGVLVGPELAENEQLIYSFKNMVSSVAKYLTPNPLFQIFPTLNRFRMWYVGKTSADINQLRKQLYDALKIEINKRFKAKEQQGDKWERPFDVLQSLIEDKNIPSHFDVYDYALEVMTLFIFAALHTTGENGTIAFYRILSYPGLIDELLEEQNQVLESEGIDKNCGPEVFTRELLNKFVKLDSAIRESLRIKNAYIDLAHVNFSDKNIVLSGGAVIRPGEYVFVDSYSNHMNPEIQKSGENDLETFEPLRYLNAEKNSAKVGEDFLIFGLGKHACPGRWFALQEIKTMLAYMIRKYEITSTSDIKFPVQMGDPFPTGTFKLVPRK
ncbi:unnamed protein product [Cunninghamella blakesleeana]